MLRKRTTKRARGRYGAGSTRPTIRNNPQEIQPLESDKKELFRRAEADKVEPS